MKFSLLALAFIGLFMVAMVPARASPALDVTDNFLTYTADYDMIMDSATDGAEDFDRMSGAIINLIWKYKPLRTPVGHGVASSLTMNPSGSGVAPTGAGIGPE